MFEPVQSALSFNIVIAIVLVAIVCVPGSTMGALIEEKKSFAGQERGKNKNCRHRLKMWLTNFWHLSHVYTTPAAQPSQISCEM